jgi:peroxiredoxin
MWLLLIFFIFLGCNSNSIKTKTYERKIVVQDFTNDSFYVQGKSYKVNFYGNEQDIEKYKNKNVPLYAIILFYKPNDGRFDFFSVLRLNHKEENIFESKEFLIPKGTSQLEISICDFSKDVNFLATSPKLPIKRADGEFEAGATVCFAPFFEKENELRQNLEYEIKTHQNFLYYASLWYWLLDKKLLKKETLWEDLKAIDTCPIKTTRLVLKLIGLNLLKENPSYIQHYMDTILMYKNLSELNDPYVDNFLGFFYSPDINELKKPFPKNFENLLLRNPLTLLFERSINILSFLRMKSNPNLISAFNERIKQKNENGLGTFGEDLAKFIIFYDKSSLDSLSFYLPQMIKYFDYLFSNNLPEIYKGIPFSILNQKRILCLHLGLALRKLGKYQESNNFLQRSLQTLKPFEYSTFEYLNLIAENFQSLSQIDSSITYYLLALKIIPENEDIIEKLVPLVEAKYPGVDPKKWINENLLKIKSYLLPEIKPDITIQTSNGNIELSKPNQELIILTFFTTNCKFCIEEMEFLRQITNNFNFKKVKVFSISYEPKEVIEHLYKVKNFNFPIVKNGSELVSYFGVSNYPTTIVIGRDGKVTNFFVGYSPETSKYLKYLVESQESQN